MDRNWGLDALSQNPADHSTESDCSVVGSGCNLGTSDNDLCH